MKYIKSLFCFFLILTLLCGCTANSQTTAGDSASAVSETESGTLAELTEKTTATEISTVTDISTALSASASEKESSSPASSAADTKTSQKTKNFADVQKLISSMSVEEKVGQLFIVFPEALAGNDGYTGLNDSAGKGAVTSAGSDVKAAIQKYHVGGIVMFAQNISTPSQITKFNSDLQAASDIPLFIAVDEEGGTVARLARNSSFNLTEYKSAASVASSGDTNDAYNMGKTIGKYLKKYGFNLDFAPVADVNSNPNNPVIGRRSFSSDPETAAKMANACAKGLKSQGIMPTFKHFPGHGDTAEDSHKSLAVNNHSLDRLMKDDWLPYLNSDLTGCAVMVGHIALPNAGAENISAALSKKVVDGYLRGTIGFNGLVITDSLKMQGVTDYYSTGEAAIMAINAGCDIILMPQNFGKAYAAVLEAVKDGTISEEHLNQSLYRILKAKSDYGIIR